MENEIIPENIEVSETMSEGATEVTTTVIQAPDYTEHFNDIILRLESIQRVQNSFYNDIIDISLFTVAAIIGLLAFKEFMDRATRW